MYSFANLDDRSWGTRDEVSAKQGNGEADGYWTSFLHGCGMWGEESLLHFLGRVRCLRWFGDQLSLWECRHESRLCVGFTYPHNMHHMLTTKTSITPFLHSQPIIPS
jgi:hypothetical protein